jgi:hypothetical protein
LATSEFRFVTIEGRDSAVPPPISGQTLSLFFQESRDSLRKALLSFMALNADQCRALATMSRLDVEVKMRCCSLPNGVAGAFVKCLQSGRGPVELVHSHIDSRIIARALTGDSRVTRFKPHSDGTYAILFPAFANNRSLVDLDLGHCTMSNENWSILCESLKAHPTLTSLNLLSTSPANPSDEQKAHRTRVVAEMIKENTVVYTIHLSANELDHQIYAESILPHLALNLYRPRVHAIKKADIALRRPLLGWALQMESVRNDSNLLWMFLSRNPDVLVSLIE